ncbi:MAG: xanthine dehydrogenase family protein subunit M, partial [Terriglobia bacterium]
MFHNVEAYHRPRSVREALRLLQSGNGGARVIAGGTDGVAGEQRSVRILIDISGAGLRYIRRRGSNHTIGGATPLAELEESVILRDIAGGILSQAAGACGSPQNRNVATLGN